MLAVMYAVQVDFQRNPRPCADRADPLGRFRAGGGEGAAAKHEVIRMGNQTEPADRYGFFNLIGIEQHVFIIIIGVVIIDQLISWIRFDRFEMLTENQIVHFTVELF